MSYSAGRLSIFVDMTTEKENYTTAVYDSMTQPAVQQLCTLFGMVVFNDLTEETTRGHRYFIGFSGADYPSYAIGWAVGNTQTDYIYLLIVGMFEGNYLSSALDAVSSSSIQASTYHLRLIAKYFPQTEPYYYYINYLKTDKFIAITDGYSGNTPTVTSSNQLAFAMFFSGTQKMASYKSSNSYYTYDANGDGTNTVICQTGTYFKVVKNVIANSDFEYLAQTYLEHMKPVDNLYLYSGVLTANKIYKINGSYYWCLTSVTADGSYMMKLDDYTP